MGDREGFRIAKIFSVLATVLVALVVVGIAFLVRQTPQTPPTPAAPSTAGPPVRIGTRLLRLEPLHKVIPRYPAGVRAKDTPGYVLIEARIDKNGVITNLKVIGGGHRLLNEAVLEAVRQWRYPPTILEGEAIEVITTIRVEL
jgi:protein TonB